MILGLTGGYCAGKSSAAAALRGAGWSVIDVDALGHAALERNKAEVAALLGPKALRPDGGPDRRAIGAMVFADASLLARYEAVVHPAMNALVAEAVEAGIARGLDVCIDAALLYRLPAAASCDAIIEVRSCLCARVARAKARDGLGLVAILDRIARQRPLWIAGRAYADRVRVVRNGGGKSRFERDLLSVASRLRSPS